MEKKIYKYATGDTIPEGAQYLSTVTQTEIDANPRGQSNWIPCWLVWHYFLVEVDK